MVRAVTERPNLALCMELEGRGPIGCGGFRGFADGAAELSIVLGERIRTELAA